MDRSYLTRNTPASDRHQDVGAAITRDRFRLGRLAEGLACLDEAMAGAIGGGLGPLAHGFAYCGTLSTGLDLFDYRRAGEWTDAIRQAAGSTGSLGYPGDCRVHRSMVMAVRGAWAEGEREAETARGECAGCDLRHAGLAAYEIGEIRRRLGDLARAEEAFREAHELGALPQPGLALLRLAQGDSAAAAASIKGALAQVTGDRLAAARLLPAQVEIALATGDLEQAQAAANALAEVARDYRTTALDAATAVAAGRCQVAAGDGEAAVSILRRARELWQEAEVPYEAARARLVLAEALHAIGDTEASLLEIQAARYIFERLGARPDANQAANRAVQLTAERRHN